MTHTYVRRAGFDTTRPPLTNVTSVSSSALKAINRAAYEVPAEARIMSIGSRY